MMKEETTKTLPKPEAENEKPKRPADEQVTAFIKESNRKHRKLWKALS